MPMVYTQHINTDTRMGVWHLSEHEDFFRNIVKLENDITHPHKRLQHLAGRFLLKELFEDFPLNSILISSTRKPFLKNDPFHFSISHCGDYAAAIVSRTHRVGVDIEIPQEKIRRISHKFINESEQKLIINTLHSPETLTMVWSIKEAIFKWYGEGKVDFKKHINIEELIMDDNMFHAVIEFSANRTTSVLHAKGLQINGNCLSWIATN